MITIFIARDVDEFAKYLSGNRFDSIKGVAYRKVTKRTAQGKKTVKVRVGEFLILQRVKSLVLLINSDDDKIKRVKEDLRDNLGNEEAVQYATTFFDVIKVFCDTLQHRNVMSFPSEKKVRFFIHWGEGDPYTYEKKFREFCVINDALINKCIGDFFVKISAYAISTRRPENFDVRGDRISIPSRIELLDELEKKFRFDSIKDCFREYVMLYQQYDGKKPYLIDSDYIIPILCQCLKDKLDEWKNIYINSKEKRKWRQETLTGLLKDLPVLETSSMGTSGQTLPCKLPCTEEYAALFSKILEEDEND